MAGWTVLSTGLATALIAAAAVAVASERMVRGDGAVSATINGAPMRLRIDPGAVAMPLLSTPAAQRAALKPGMIGIGYAVGPIHVRGRTAVAAIGLDGTTFKRRIGWTDAPYSADVDGVIGPGGVPEPVVRFALRPRAADDQAIVLPMADPHGLGASWGDSLATTQVGDIAIELRFDPRQPVTLAPAGLGARIAGVLGGIWEGEVVQREIVFGIKRPVRTMRLAKPLAIGTLTLTALGVRTGDFGNAGSIPEKDADPDEIVVTAKTRAGRRSNRLTIGNDLLSRCSELVFDKTARQIRLSCR